MSKLVRITTIPLSLEKLLEGQLTFMNQYYEVVAVSAERDRLIKYGIDNNVATFHVELTRAITPLVDLKAVWKLYKYLKKETPLIVHTHTPKAGIIGMLAAKLAGVPIRLHTVAGLPLLETKGIKRRILNSVETITYSLATKVYPNSKGLEQIILAEKFASISKLKVLGRGSSNGIDTSYFNPQLYSEAFKSNFKSSIGINANNFVFVYVGRLVSEKGINELIAAFNELNEKEPNLSLLLVGPFENELDPLEPETLSLIDQHPEIFSVGYQADVRPYFAISNALAFPSYREGFPNVVMQAGAMNLPSIVTDINGCNEIITNNFNGLIIPVKNKNSLYEAMYNMLMDSKLLEIMKGNSRKLIVANYEREEFWKILLEEYRELEKRH
ncbi:glycosyltransferase family 4 protein [Gillisia sp. M10.2A]|uniref:Glycosyltransferase family 4 protein n=1 Tax=Gillisia lutea TaxID=2909668 RepID=A0ABS9EME9_9FLAO|nr:glycosyltransferase family 4 protein [Gillisia lutea]MCF4102678.1 glycosyltransferase family 4 protein [Gillisia lutea]